MLRVASSSMHPRLEEGDEVEIERVSHRRLMPGDIVVFSTSDAGLVVHRLIWGDPLGRSGRIITKGDALGYLDRAIAPERVLGRVVVIKREGVNLHPTTVSDRVRCLGLAAGYGVRRWARRYLGPGLSIQREKR